MRRVLLCALGLLLTGAAAALSYPYRIAIDPGHGGDDSGTGPGWDPVPPCWESMMNLYMGLGTDAQLYYMDSFDTRMTRSGDYNVSVAFARNVANNWPAHAFVALHINACPAPEPPPYDCSACDHNDTLAFHWLGTGSFLSDLLAGNIAGEYCTTDGGSIASDDASRFAVLNGLTMPGSLVEVDWICNTCAGELCDGGERCWDVAWGIRWALCQYFYIGLPECSTTIGTSFVAVGGLQHVALHWQDPDPGTTCTIRRSDSCWGPYTELIATVPWNSSGEYSYVDDSVWDDREYSYEIVVSPSGERVTAEATPWGLGPPMNPDPPSNLTAVTEYGGGTTGTVTLTWTGAPSGYGYTYCNVFRGPVPLSSCHVATLRGTTGELIFEDADVGVGDTYYYRVVADDAVGHSVPSNEVAVCILGEFTGAPEANRVRALTLRTEGGGYGGVALAIETRDPEVVRLDAYNVQGQRVAVLLEGLEVRGRYTYYWEGKGDRGGQLSSGVYFIRLVTASGQERRTKAILVR